MRLSGTLRSWNDNRGFGFIAPTHGGPELFVHVSALPRDGSRPTIGEKLTYELGRGKNGKPQATNVQRLAVGNQSGRVPTGPSRRARPFLARAGGLIVLFAVSIYGYQYQTRAKIYERSAESPTSSSREGKSFVAEPPAFKCDGRKYCSQMTSCSEAKLFLKNCPGTEMDGNHDGVPCEKQWCTSPFAK